MKKIFVCLTSALFIAAILTSCGEKQCNMCEKSCSAKHSYNDGQVILCDSCYKKCFDAKIEVNADEFFAVTEQAE